MQHLVFIYDSDSVKLKNHSPDLKPCCKDTFIESYNKISGHNLGEQLWRVFVPVPLQGHPVLRLHQHHALRRVHPHVRRRDGPREAHHDFIVLYVQEVLTYAI